MFVDKASGPNLEWSTWKVFHSGRLRPWTRLEGLARDKHSSLLRKAVNYGCKSFIGLAPVVNLIKHLLIPFCKLNRFVSKTIFLSVLWNDLAFEKGVNLFLRVLLANPMKKFLENLLNFSWRLDHFIPIKIFYLTQKRSSLQIRAGRKKRYLLVAAIFSFC